MPHANSTMSMPRVTSPCASLKTLPCSAVIIAASVSRSRLSRSRKALHDARAAQRRRVGPGRLRRLGGGDGGVDLGRRGERDAARDRAGRRVGDRLAAAARAGDAAAADEMADVGRAGEGFVGAHGRSPRSIGLVPASLPGRRLAPPAPAPAAGRSGERRHRRQHRRRRAPHQERELVDDGAQGETRRSPARRAARSSLRSTPGRRRGC